MNTFFFYAIVTTSLFCMGLTTMIMLRLSPIQTPLDVAFVVGVGVPLMVTFLTFMIRDVHLDINDKLTELRRAEEDLVWMRGVLHEKERIAEQQKEEAVSEMDQ